jgi:hypothetical protein
MKTATRQNMLPSNNSEEITNVWPEVMIDLYSDITVMVTVIRVEREGVYYLTPVSFIAPKSPKPERGFELMQHLIRQVHNTATLIQIPDPGVFPPGHFQGTTVKDENQQSEAERITKLGEKHNFGIKQLKDRGLYGLS